MQRRVFSDRVELDVFDDADDLAPLDVVDVGQPQRLADGRTVWPQRPRRALADDRDAGRLRCLPNELCLTEAIVHAEGSAGDEAYAHEREVAVADGVLYAGPARRVRGRVAASGHRGDRRERRERDLRRDRRTLDAGNGFEPFAQAIGPLDVAKPRTA